MILHNLSCFRAFQCIAGACPDTCCAGWEVDLDEDTVARYKNLPGPMGVQVRSHMKTEDGYTFFALNNGACPFLNADKLCDLILTFGDCVLSETCREHPRFWAQYGDLQETCLSISCPEAARLLFREPFELVETRSPEPSEEPLDDFDTDVLHRLLQFRQHLTALTFEERPLTETFARLDDFAESSQGTLDELSTGGNLSELVFPSSATIPNPWIPELRRFLQGMRSMEFTQDELKERISFLLNNNVKEDKILSKLDMPELRPYGQKLLSYFLYRYLPRALWHLEILDKLRFCIYGTMAILAIAVTMPTDNLFENVCKSAVVFSREVEHSDENLNLLLDTVCTF